MNPAAARCVCLGIVNVTYLKEEANKIKHFSNNGSYGRKKMIFTDTRLTDTRVTRDLPVQTYLCEKDSLISSLRKWPSEYTVVYDDQQTESNR